MHSFDFFRRRGFYCQSEFLDRSTRTGLLEQIRKASPTPAQVFNGAPDAVVVIFLNAMSTEPGPSDYSGGALTFYGLLEDPAWRDFGFALDPMPGLLVAFPSHIVHEVTPVTAGDRYTIVDWFTV